MQPGGFAKTDRAGTTISLGIRGPPQSFRRRDRGYPQHAAVIPLRRFPRSRLLVGGLRRRFGLCGHAGRQFFHYIILRRSWVVSASASSIGKKVS
jgi:hypothetical protein